MPDTTGYCRYSSLHGWIMDIKLERRQVTALKTYAANTKRHTDADVALIAASIRRFGFNDPIGILPDGTIVEGHGRLQAAISEGLTEVPVLVLENFSERDADRYRIAHNKITLAGTFDFQLLAGSLRELLGDDISFENMGFSASMGDQILTMFREDNTQGRVVKSKTTGHTADIVWDNAEQKARWDNFVKRLQAAGGPNTSITEVLSAFIQSREIVAPQHEASQHV